MLLNDLLVYCDWLEDQGQNVDAVRVIMARRQANLCLSNGYSDGNGYGYGYGDGDGDGYGYSDGNGDGNGYGNGERK